MQIIMKNDIFMLKQKGSEEKYHKHKCEGNTSNKIWPNIVLFTSKGDV